MIKYTSTLNYRLNEAYELNTSIDTARHECCWSWNFRKTALSRCVALWESRIHTRIDSIDNGLNYPRDFLFEGLMNHILSRYSFTIHQKSKYHQTCSSCVEINHGFFFLFKLALTSQLAHPVQRGRGLKLLMWWMKGLFYITESWFNWVWFMNTLVE